MDAKLTCCFPTVGEAVEPPSTMVGMHVHFIVGLSVTNPLPEIPDSDAGVGLDDAEEDEGCVVACPIAVGCCVVEWLGVLVDAKDVGFIDGDVVIVLDEVG